MGGQDQAKGKIVRIGHMGYFTKNDILQSWERLQSALTDLGHQITNPKELESIRSEFLKLEEFYS